MRSTPFFQCHNCKRILELNVEDLAYLDRDCKKLRLGDQPARPDCPCKTRLYVHPSMANDIIKDIQAEEEIVEKAVVSEPGVATPEAPPPPASPGRAKKSDDEKRAEAVAAKDAVEKHGTQAAAAEALGVSVQTVRNRLKYLEASGTVPGTDD